MLGAPGIKCLLVVFQPVAVGNHSAQHAMEARIYLPDVVERHLKVASVGIYAAHYYLVIAHYLAQYLGTIQMHYGFVAGDARHHVNAAA